MNIKKINFNSYENEYKKKEYFLKFLTVPLIIIIKQINNCKFQKTKQS